MIIGARQTGKTSLALRLVNNFGRSLATDETSVLHLRSRVVEPFPTAIPIKDPERQGERVAASSLCHAVRSDPAIIDCLVFLDKAMPSTDMRPLARIDQIEALRRILPERLELHGGADAAMVSIMDLIANTPAYTAELTRHSYDEVAEAISAITSPEGIEYGPRGSDVAAQ